MSRRELIKATEQFKTVLGAQDPSKLVAAKAKKLKEACAEIEKIANSGDYVALDNWARRTDQLESMCRLVVKHLRKAEGYTPPEKR